MPAVRVPRLTDGIVLLGSHTLADVAAQLAGEDEEQARRFGWFPARSTEQTARAGSSTGNSSGAQAARREPSRFARRRPASSSGVVRFDLPRTGIAAMSYWLFPSYRRRGHSTRAVRLACDYAFAALDVKRVALHIAPDNAASRRVARRADLSEVRRYATRREAGEDEVLYSREAKPHSPSLASNPFAPPGTRALD